MLRLNSLALATVLFLSTACGDAPDHSATRNANQAGLALPALSQQATEGRGPAQVAAAFMGAIKAEDEAAWEALLTTAAVAEMHREGAASMNFNGDQLDSWSTGEATVEGEHAGVVLNVEQAGEEQSFTLRLRREAGHWRVFGMAMPMGDSEWEISFEGGEDDLSQLGQELAEGLAEGMEEAFEDAMSEWEAGGSTAEIARGRAYFDALGSTSEVEHDEAWSVDVLADGRTAADVLTELFAGTGFPVPETELFDHASSVALSSVSRLEGLEALCVEAGVVPVFPDSMAAWNDEPVELTFEVGARTWPVAFAGPFMLEVGALEEHAPNSTGELTVVARALGLSPSVLAANQEMSSFLTFESVTSPSGKNLLADPDVSYMGSPTVEAGLFEYSLSLDLTHLLRSVESLSLGCAVAISLPTEVHSGMFADASSDASAQAGPWTATWDDRGTSNQVSFRHSDGETSEGSVRFAPEFGPERPMGIQSESAYDVGGYLSANVATPETPAALGFKVFSSSELEYRFALEGVALASFAQQPSQLEPLAFAGPAPVAVEFTGFGDRSDPDFPKVTVLVSGRCNLTAVEAGVTFEYLDAAGSVLKDFPHSLTGEFTFEGTAPLALVDQTSQLETTAFFMPQETATVRVRVDSVKFLNGTMWERE